MTDTTGQTPYRVVGCDGRGWYATVPAADSATGEVVYRMGYDSPEMTYDMLAAAYGPLRPVLPLTDADESRLRELIDAAGRKAVTTLAAALETTFHQIRAGLGSGDPLAGSYGMAMQRMTAGRAGSWEAALLRDVIVFGNGLNLAKETPQLRTPAARRDAGPVRRVDRAARDGMAEVIGGWVNGPDRYTELAETLAGVMSAAADRHGPAGWAKIADQWLQPGGLAVYDTQICYRLFYSRSEHYQSM